MITRLIIVTSSQSETIERLTEAIVLFAAQSDHFVFPPKLRFHSLGLIPFCVPAVNELCRIRKAIKGNEWQTKQERNSRFQKTVPLPESLPYQLHRVNDFTNEYVYKDDDGTGAEQ